MMTNNDAQNEHITEHNDHDERTPLLVSADKARVHEQGHDVMPRRFITKTESSWSSSAASLSTNKQQAKQPLREGTALGSVFNLVNSAVGSGVLSFPWAYRSTGLAMALLVTVAAFGLTQFTQLVLIRTAHRHRAPTLQALVHRALGTSWAHVTSVVVLLYIFGACSSYLIILSDALEVPLRMMVSPFWTMGTTSVMMLRRLGLSIVGWGLVFPLCLARNLADLERVSASTLVSALFLLTVVVLRARGATADDISWWHLTDWLDPDVSPLNAPPVAILAFQAHIQTVPILFELGEGVTASTSQKHGCSCDPADEIKEGRRSRNDNARTSSWTIKESRMAIFVAVAGSICFVVYSAMGVFGYITFGDHGGIESNILNSYSDHDPLVAVARVVVGLVMVVSYPVNQFCAQSAVLDVWAALTTGRSDHVVNEESPTLSRDRDGRFVALVFFAATYTVALFVQNLGLVFDIVGATVGVYVIIILPAALLYKDPDGMFPVRVATFVVLVLVGLAICSSTLTMQILAV